MSALLRAARVAARKEAREWRVKGVAWGGESAASSGAWDSSEVGEGA